MLDGIVSTNSLNFLLVFLEGLLSFLSPCVIPLIPVYMGYLAGNAKQTNEDGTIIYKRKKVFFHTVFFVLGISFAFFILGMSFTALGSFFSKNQLLFTRMGGILIVFLGLYQIGFLDFKFLQKERKFHIKLKNTTMNPIAAFLMGFTFSFAWTPCVGPALSSVLILASSASNRMLGYVLVLIYTAGFIIPFLLLGLFTTQVLNFLKGHQKLLKYTVKAGGVLLIIIGIMTFTGWMNGVSKYLNAFVPPTEQQNSTTDESTIPESTNEDTDTDSKADKKPAAFDFTLTDQYGAEHTLSDYNGKVVFLNFWASWCSPCKAEMPDIEALYKEYGENQEDIIFLGVANPSSAKYPNNNDVEKDKILAFLEDSGFTFPTVFDESGDIFRKYSVNSFPSTFLIDDEGNVFGYAPGMITKDMMINAITQAKESTE
ncbi:MAG TPA: cytochrome c biogenesis protein CcdA [Mobilitalea sp.]|nr:cytochrome c biogenesis protein CcdA [Mobilitalea sp.]